MHICTPVREEYSIKIRAISLKVQNCSNILIDGYVRDNTKTQFTRINIEMLHVNHKILSTFFNKVCDKASKVEIMPC